MKDLKILKALFLTFCIVLSRSAFSNEPQLKFVTKKNLKLNHKSSKLENLSKYEINNHELVQLYGFSIEKKQIKKKDIAPKKSYFARNIEAKNFIFL